jgi:hypothetical protein
MAKPPSEIEARHDWTLEVPEPIAQGVYPATVSEIVLRENEADGREWLAWDFVLDDGRRIGGGTSYAIGVRTKAYAWISALVGRERMGGGVQIVESDLTGARCQIVVELDADGLPKVGSVLPPVALSLGEIQAVIDDAQA